MDGGGTAAADHRGFTGAKLSVRVKVGLIGLGAIGRVHFECWRNCPDAELVGISARDPEKLAGNWSGQAFNLGDQSAERVDLNGLAKYPRYEDLLADPEIEIVDICLPTPLHAPIAIAALRAGKHVLCEKPMALSLAECAAMEGAATEAQRYLMVGHCLRYWPHYLRAQQILASGEYGRVLYGRFFRTSAAPVWSGDGWFMRPEESGGVLDMHIHDIDVALWWFGRPANISVTGHSEKGLPLMIDAHWRYDDGPTLQLHSAWDRNGGAFRHGFQLVLERATLSYDLALENGALQLITDGETKMLAVDEPRVHQAEIDDFAAAVARGGMLRITPNDSRLAVEIGLEELRQLGA